MTAPAFEDLPDADLLAQCRAGSQPAWAAMVRRYQSLIFTIPRRAGLDEHLAADVFQATFKRLYEHIKHIDRPEAVRAWLVTTARRETLQLLAERRRHPVAPAAPESGPDAEDPSAAIADNAPLPPEQLEHLQLQDRVWRAVKRLDPRSRLMIELLFLRDEALPYSEVARQLGISEGSIGPTRARCIDKLRAAMENLD